MPDILVGGDFLSALLFAGVLALMALGRSEVPAARWLVYLGSAIVIVRWEAWSMFTDAPWYLRAVAGAVFGAALLTGSPALLHWFDKKEAAEAAEVSTTERGGSAAAISNVNIGNISVGQPAAHTGGTINIYNAPVTQTLSEKPAMSAQDKPPVTINAPGSIIAPSGGTNTINNSFGPVPRRLANMPELQTQIVKEMPRDKPITVMAIMGDGESIQLAQEIHGFMKAQGFPLKEDGISQGVYSAVIKGLRVEPNAAKDGWTFIVGTNLP